MAVYMFENRYRMDDRFYGDFEKIKINNEN